MEMELLEGKWQTVDRQLTTIGVGHLDGMAIVDDLVTSSLITKRQRRQFGLDGTANINRRLVFAGRTGCILAAEMTPVCGCDFAFITPVNAFIRVGSRKGGLSTTVVQPVQSFFA